MGRSWAVFLVLLLVIGCGTPSSGIVVAGSTSIQPVADMLAEAFTRQGGSVVNIQGGGSTAGVEAVLSGVAHLGAVSRRLSADETRRGLVEHIIGYDVLTIVVHPRNPVTGLTRAQLSELFAGEVRDWAGVGGRPGPVYLVVREAGSGSRAAFRSLVGPMSPGALVQGSSGAIRMAIMQNPQAVGYISLGVAAAGGVKPLDIDGRAPGRPGYTLVRPLSFVTVGPAQGAAAEFLEFARSPAGQDLIRQEGLLPAPAATRH